MRYKNTIEAISMQLHEVQKNIAYWEVNEDIRQIDIDTALAKLRDIYDALLEMKTSENINPIEDVGKRVVEFTTETTSDSEPLKEVEEPQPTLSAPVQEEPKATIPEPKEEIIEDKAKPTHTEHVHGSKSLGETFNTSRPTLNEELSAHVHSEDLARQLKSRPITNLSAAIGLNEKFELLNNLFHGDKEAYNETIERLNAATNFNEAYNYLSGKLNWKMDDPLVQRLLELIRRKLIVKKQ